MADRALLVGINAYPRQPLRGCINDVQDIAKLLVEARGFGKDGIRLMIDGDASAAGIKQAVAEWLIKGAAPGDRLVFHYSGHGSRLLDKAGEIHDVICPVDFDFTLERSLSDEDFRKLFAPIPSGAHFSWISDSCHSGDLARSFGMRDVLPRYLPPPPEIAAAIEKALSRRALTRGLVVADEHVNGVLIAGCKSTEESADAKINGRYNGALTYYFVKQLRATKGLDTDIETIVTQTGKALEDERYEQHPQVRGLPTLRKLPFAVALQMAAAAAAQQQAASVTAASVPATAAPATPAQPPAQPPTAAAVTAPPAAPAPAAPNPAASATKPDEVAADDELAGATSMTLEEVAEARGWREREDVTTRGPGGGAPTTMSKAELAAIPNEKIAALVSDETHALVIAAEIGSKAEYDKKYRFPEWPQGESGVTIGFGSDLGYFDQTSMKSAWGGLIEDVNYNRLEKCCGLKGSKASAALGSVKDISVPWEKADVAYHRHEVPEYGRQVIGAFPNAMELHPHSFGALFSLVYNRGPGMGSAGDDKRKEMRNIRDLMAKRQFDKVPAEFRAMKRLWVGKFAGLVKRREDEAKLFEKGLKAKLTEPATAAATASPAPAPVPMPAPTPAVVAQPGPPPAPQPAVAVAPASTPAVATPASPAATTVASASPAVPAAASAPASAAPSPAAVVAPSAAANPPATPPATTPAAIPPAAASGVSPAVQSALDKLAAIPAAAAASAAAATGAAGATANAAGPTVTESRGLRDPEGDGRGWGDDFESDQGPVSRGDEWSAVHWPKNDEDSTEYRHLADHPLKGATFDFTGDDVELLIAANAFEPTKENGKIIFGLRGAELVVAQGGNAQDKFKQIGRKSLRLKETRPDHQHFRCVIGAYDPATRELSGFIASTVPCRQAIIGYINGGEGSNMLPSGCYDYVCGPHKDRQGCLRENEDFTVLRTKKNPQFDVKDNWDLNFPADNLHPAFSNKSAEFSSWGCQTIRGNHNKDDGSFSGEYNEFRNVLGLKPRAQSHGLKFSYVMVTGLEAAIASDLRKNGRSKDVGEVTKALGRLRHGSRGERVRALQAKLGIATDGVFNAAVRKALAAQQIKAMGWADGLYWPEMDQLLGFDVFKPKPVAAQPAAPAVAVAAPAAPAPTPQPAPAVQPPSVAQPAPAPQPAAVAPAAPAPTPVQVAAPKPTAPSPAATPATASGGSGASPAIQTTLNQMTATAATTAPKPQPAASEYVDCSIFAPAKVSPKLSFPIQVSLHRPDQARRTEAMASLIDSSAGWRGGQSLSSPLENGAIIEIELDGRGITIDEPYARLVWRGEPIIHAFSAEIPANQAASQYMPVARLTVGGQPIGRVAFKIEVGQGGSPQPSELARGLQPYNSAFLSYANGDREVVLRSAQALRAANIEIFQDVVSLSAGDEFREKILDKIGQSDLFMLFWSTSAQGSQWVQKEIEHALACQKKSPDGLPDIRPMVLEGPDKAPPPQKLAHLHFNDVINHLVAAEQSRRSPSPVVPAVAAAAVPVAKAVAASQALDKPAAAAPKRRGKRGRVALVIGNSAYRHAKALRNPVYDAALMTRHLVRNGFKTIIGGVDPGDLTDSERRKLECQFDGLNLDRHHLFQGVQAFLDAIEEGSEALIYYAGHGIQIGDQNYLVPVDTTLASDDPIAELVPLNRLIENAVAKAGSSGKVIVLLDACRSNPFSDRQLHDLSEKLSRGMTADGKPAPRTYVTGGGLAPPNVKTEGGAAPTFISYATAPGAVAYDGSETARNSPFAEALGRHISTRGLPLADVVRRACRDVQDRVRLANHGRVQDPWISTDLTDDYFIKTRSFWPAFAMAVMGLVAGVATCFLLFQGELNRLIDPFNGFWPWAVGLLFGLVTMTGTLLWGSGKWRDAIYAAAGCSLSFMLALTVLQLISITGRTPVAPLTQDLVQLVADVGITFKVLAGVAAAFMLLGSLMCWPRSQWSVRGFLKRGYYLLLPLVLGLSLFSLQRRLGVAGQIGLIMVSLISGVLFTAGTVLALKPQHSVFRGFGALTGAITIGLAMPMFFDIYFQLEPLGLVDPKLLALGLGALWFGLLGAQIGYCFAYYIPEHEPLES